MCVTPETDGAAARSGSAGGPRPRPERPRHRRAESVSALIAQGLELLQARAQLEAVVTELHSEVGALDDQAKARLSEALAAADEAYRGHRDSSAGRAGHAALEGSCSTRAPSSP